ncbi:MAG: hypothetical protein HC896_17285 [Bacteroidales bacterium]|nr:hypothetical protein [Bacteroidales bacterium]
MTISTKKTLLYLILPASVFLLAANAITAFIEPGELYAQNTSQRLTKKCQAVENAVSSITNETTRKELYETFDGLAGQGVYVSVFSHGLNPVYWNTNKIDVDSNWLYAIERDTLILLNNTWVLATRYSAGDFQVLSCIDIYNEFSFENNFIKNGFHPRSGCQRPLGSATSQATRAIRCYLRANRCFMFSIVSDPGDFNLLNTVKAITFAFIVLLVFYFNGIMLRHTRNTRYNAVKVFVSLAFIMLVIERFIFPNVKELTILKRMFQPNVFAHSSFLPDLAHLLLYTFGLYHAVFHFSNYVKANSLFAKNCLLPLLQPCLLPVSNLYISWSTIPASTLNCSSRAK